MQSYWKSSVWNGISKTCGCDHTWLKSFKAKSFSSIFYMQKSMCSLFEYLNIIRFLSRNLLALSLQGQERNMSIRSAHFHPVPGTLISWDWKYIHLSLIATSEVNSEWSSCTTYKCSHVRFQKDHLKYMRTKHSSVALAAILWDGLQWSLTLGICTLV